MNLNELIKNNPGINITINAEDLKQFGESIATNTVKTILEKHEEKIYSRKEVIEKFGVCSATLWRWDKLELIESKKIGNRRFYPESEIKRILKRREE